MKYAKQHKPKFKIVFSIEKKYIEAKTFQLSANWTVEPIDIINCQYSQSIFGLFDKRKMKRAIRKGLL